MDDRDPDMQSLTSSSSLQNMELAASQQFYEDALCWLGRPQYVYRLLSEAVLPPVSSWVRGSSSRHTVNSWQVEQIRTFLYPVLAFEETNTTEVLCSEAMLLCGDGNYYNPCDVAIAVFVQRPQEPFSQLFQRIRLAEATILRGPRAMMTTEHVSLARTGTDYINTKYLIWPYRIRTAAIETLTKQGMSHIKLSPAEANLPFLQAVAES
ncbi:MAG: hypothetical protein AAF268_02470 [Cyanobacteria bacterium P01_A01_bin.3]